MQDHDPAKRIPKSLGTGAKLFGTYTLTDLAVGVLPGVIVVLVTQVVLPSPLVLWGVTVQSVTLPLALGAMGLGAVFVYLTPAHMTSTDWVATFLGFHTSPARITHEAAREYTHVERVYPEQDAVERTDGAFLGFVEVKPPTMALATEAEWAAKAEGFQEFLNTAVEFPIQIYSTTRAFPVDEYLAHYEARLDDPDVEANPQLTALIEQYIEWYESDLDDRRMTIRDHYVVVPVTPSEVMFERESLAQKLAAVPVLGVLVEAWFAPRREEQRAAMFEALDDRVGRVETGLREIEGCEADRVDAEAAARLVAEFWAGEQVEYGSMEKVLRTQQLVGGPDR
ncbi:MAG: hypothetical protein ABEH77_02705 [Halobacteriaceae archaeon]